ncbi:DUF6879 family protein [Streptomyces yunnanensis]|uniref:DUF6879 domain-containing protein n=1 Tax=Streptomyces yunnanensis TaxID=156453 RepID=A0A9X8MTE7_9ACTN|nr:DUF6879 family protein [Streptomyces yunnanensis]SHL76254.1 hypothetical protein SAMN05216268_106109 [Streptomyces yunnanensis]
MPDLIPFPEVAHYFRDFEHTAWRLETRRGYASDRNGPKWQRFLRGEDIANEPDNAWRANVRTQVAAGKRFERVRLVDQPATEGQRFLLASGLGNVAAGEDIRNLYRSEAHSLSIPDGDFWLFDSRVVAEFEFDDHDVTLGVRVHEDAETVVRACQVRDAAWHHAVPTREFQARVLSDV